MLFVSGVLTSLNLAHNFIKGEGGKAIADSLRVNSVLTSLNLLRNNLDTASANALAEVAKTKRISLCGIKPDQTTANFRQSNLKPPDAVLLASDLSLTNVSSVLTDLNLSGNHGVMKAALREIAKGRRGVGQAALRMIAKGRPLLTLEL